MFTNWVIARRQPDRDAPAREARRRCSGSRPSARRPRRAAYLSVDTSTGARRGHHQRGDAVPRQRRPLRAGNGADAVASLWSSGSRHGNPAVTLRTSAPTAVRPRPSPTTSRARSSRRARATRRGPARSATAVAPIRSDDHVLRTPRAARLARPLAQGRHPVGGRAAAAAREPHHRDGRGRRCRASGTCPTAEGGRRAHRRRPRPRRHRGTAHVRRTWPPARAGCSVADWQCVRSTSYIYPDVPADRTPRRRSTTRRQGFEIALHLTVNGPDDCSTVHAPADARTPTTPTQLPAFASRAPEPAGPATTRTHCIVWSDCRRQPQAELAHGIRLDTNYYYWPGSWVGRTAPASSPARASRSASPTPTARSSTSTRRRRSSTTSSRDTDRSADRANSLHACSTTRWARPGYYGVFTANNHNDLEPGAGQPTTSSRPRRRRTACRSSPPSSC